MLDAHSPKLRDSRIVDADVRERIRRFLPGDPDNWWEIAESTDVGPSAAEVTELVFREAAPFMLRHMSTDAILDLWESGRSP